MNICEHCDNFGNYGHMAKVCTIADYRDGSEGYGPFFSKATCIHDERLRFPASKYEPISERSIKRREETIKSLQSEKDRLVIENEKLKERLTKV